MQGEGKPSGFIFVDGVQVGITLQCAHCTAHWEPRPGSGKRRGWCYACQKPVCGADLCLKYCAPTMARLEFIESMAAGDFKNAKKLADRFPGIDKLAL